MWWLVGCDLCTGWEGPTVEDPHGLADEDTVARLQRAADDFYTWTGATDVCVDTITVTDTDEKYALAGYLGGVDVALPAWSTPSDHELRAALCETWLSIRSTDWTEEDIRACADGPARTRFADAVGAACGHTELTAHDATLRATIWTNPPTYDDGRLTLTTGTSRVLSAVPAAGFSLSALDALGDAMIVDEYVWEADVLSEALSVVDPDNGELRARLGAVDGILHGGVSHAVMLDWLDAEHTAITVVDPDGSARSLTSIDVYASSSAVVGDTLIAYDDWSETGSPLTLIDLGTGADRTLELPPAPAGLATWVTAIAEVSPTVALVHLLPAEVETECGSFDCVSTVGVVTERLYRLDLVTGAWTDLGEDVNFYPTGTRSDGVVFGRAYMPAGTVNAAWDPVADTWWVDEDTCVTPTTPGGVVVDDRLWTATKNDDRTELTVTPIALSLD